MIRQRNTIKKSIPSDSLIPSDQILISIIDAIVSVSLFSVGLALIIGGQAKGYLSGRPSSSLSSRPLPASEEHDF